MNVQLRNRRRLVKRSCRVLSACFVAIAALLVATASVDGAIAYDAESATGPQWWFDPVNWNVSMNVNNLLPPNGGSAFDAQINLGTGGLPGGEGVVYDPANDPSFPNAANLSYPPDRGPQIIDQLYISRNTLNHNLLTIKGDLTSMANVIVGRSGSTGTAPEQQNEGRINQLGGTVKINFNALDMGQREASGWGNGIYDYRGGILEVSLDGGSGVRLSAGGSSGPGGHGRFIMHNPTTPGYVRAFDFNVAANAGTGALLPDGITTGVGIVEFHFENGGTRPIQVPRNLLINNGSTETGAVRSARLELVLNAAPMVDGGGVPQNLGLFDVDFDGDGTGSNTAGAGSLGDFFSSADGSTLYDEGAMVSASFGGTQYNWNISYTGNITWADPDAGTISSIDSTGGIDVVLVGLSSMSIGLPGDYNNNGVVDAADYVVWRNSLGPGSLPNESASPGVVDDADYTFWRTQFGNGAAGGGAALVASAAVPEPGMISLIALGAIGLFVGHRTGRRI